MEIWIVIHKPPELYSFLPVYCMLGMYWLIILDNHLKKDFILV